MIKISETLTDTSTYRFRYDRASAVDPVDVMYAWSAYLEHNSESLRSHGWTQAPSVHEITSLVSSIIPLAREVNAGGEDLTIHGVMWAALENESGAGDGSIRAGRWSSNYMSDMLIEYVMLARDIVRDLC